MKTPVMSENHGLAASCSPPTEDGVRSPGLCPDGKPAVTSWVIGRRSTTEPPAWAPCLTVIPTAGPDGRLLCAGDGLRHP